MMSTLLPALLTVVSSPATGAPGTPYPTIADCALPDTIRPIHTLAALPAGVHFHFEARIGALSDVGGPFNPTDSSGDDSPPQRRFLGGAMRGQTLVIWYEHGGRAHTNHAVGFVINPNPRPGRAAIERLPNAHFTGNLCAATLAFMDGVSTHIDGVSTPPDFAL